MFLEKLRPFMFQKNPGPKTPSSLFWYPDEGDSLFWCFFFIQNGEKAYYLRKDRSFLSEKNLKIEYVEKLKDGDSPFYSKELEHNLVYDRFINIASFLALCSFAQIPHTFLIINGSKPLHDARHPTMVIQFNVEKKQFGIRK
jgi:hypothetical protein